jgi:hypothetical protein
VPQKTDGLDKLVSANGQSSAPINDFVAASNFQAELQATAAAVARTSFFITCPLCGKDLTGSNWQIVANTAR